MSTLYFIRHGQTDWNAAARLQGQTDTLLNDTGEQQARDNGARLSRHFAETGVDLGDLDFVTSPLTRARRTAEHIALSLGLDGTAFQPDPQVSEIKFGSWEGMTRAEIREATPDDYAEYERSPWEFRPPGAESYQMLSDRVLTWLHVRSRPTVVVSHGGVMRVLRRHFERVDNDKTPVLSIPQDQIYYAHPDGVDWL